MTLTILRGGALTMRGHFGYGRVENTLCSENLFYLVGVAASIIKKEHFKILKQFKQKIRVYIRTFYVRTQSFAKKDTPSDRF